MTVKVSGSVPAWWPTLIDFAILGCTEPGRFRGLGAGELPTPAEAMGATTTMTGSSANRTTPRLRLNLARDDNRLDTGSPHKMRSVGRLFTWLPCPLRHLAWRTLPSPITAYSLPHWFTRACAH